MAGSRDEGQGSAAWIAHLKAFPHGDVHSEAPCVGCGVPTGRRAIVSVTPAVGLVSDKAVRSEGVAWCGPCELKRNRAQAERVAANDAVFPEIRASMRRFLEETAA